MIQSPQCFLLHLRSANGNQRTICKFILCLVLAGLATSCASLPELNPFSKDEANVDIERSLKSKLLQEQGVEAAALRVSLISGVIQLTGVVSSEEAREKSEEIANNAYPRYRVINEIVVRQ